MRIRSSGMVYAVDWTPGEVLDELAEDRFVGRTVHMENRIVISSRAPEGRQRQALIHELVHVVDDGYKVGLTEKQVSRFSRGLFALLMDNPDAVRYVVAGKRPKKKKHG